MTVPSAEDDLDPRELVFETLLREAAGGATAPDLVDAVAARLAVGSAGARRRRFVAAAAGAAAGVAAAVFACWPSRSHERLLVPWQVAQGCVTWIGRDATATARAPERAQWPVAVGDRVRTCPNIEATSDIGALGRLHMSQGSEIEVENMEWKAFGGGAALGAVTVAVVSGVIRWSGGGEPAQAGTGERLELRSLAPASAAAKIDTLQEQVANLQRELAAASARARDLEGQASRTVAANKDAAAAAAAEEEPPPHLQHAFTYGGMEPALAAIDWDVTGKCMHEMTAKLDVLMAALEKGEDMPLDVLGEIQSLNAELIKQAGALLKAKVAGTGPNGVFTNPIVAANQIHATLTKAGMPLSAAQEDALRLLSAQIAGEDEARRGAVPADGFELEALLGETGLKDRFYRQARGLLTPEQERALFPERLAGASANLFDTGLVWAQFARPMEVRDRDDFASQVSRSVLDHLGLSGDADPQVRAAVAAWASRMPDDAFVVGDRLSRTGLGKLGPVRAAAQRQLELLRELQRTLPLTDAQKAKLRAAGPVFMPYLRK